MPDGADRAWVHPSEETRLTVSAPDLAEAVPADLVAMMSLLHAPPIGEVHADAEATWFLTGAPTPNANGVLHAELPTGDLDAAIEDHLAPFRARSLPMMWWRFTPPRPSDPATDEALHRRGLVLDADRPGFGMELTDLREPVVPIGVRIERVGDNGAFGS